MNNEIEKHYAAGKDETTVVDKFIRALVKDAQSPEPALHWEYVPGETENEPDKFAVNGFSGSDAQIILSMTDITDEHDSYKLVYYRKGEQILSAQEYALLTEQSDLRQLHSMVSHGKDCPRDELEKYEEIRKFITDTDERIFLDRILGKDFPTTTPVLVGDVFRTANATKVVEAYIKNVIKNDKKLSAEELRRIRALATAIISAIRHLKREPNGATFSPRPVSAVVVTNKPVRTTSSLSSISQIANSMTTWHEIYVDSPETHKENLNRTAVMLLTAIMQEK